MNEQDFEQLLYQEANQLSPNQLSSPLPAPWRCALKQLTWGLALTSITLNHFYLNFLLPTLGGVLIWLGFRSLRRQNLPFRVGYVLSWIQCLLHLVHLTLLATPATQYTPLLFGISLFISLINWSFYLCLWLGLRGVFQQAHLPPKTRSAGWLVVGYALILGMALISFHGFFLLLPFLILWILLLVGLFRTHRCLDETGYAIRPAPVRVANGRAAAAWLGLTALAVVVSLSLSLHLPLLGEIPLTYSTQSSPLRPQLEELGFPAELLEQLPDRQVAELEGATHIQVDSSSNSDAGDLSMDVVSVMFTQTGDVKMFAFFHWETPPDQRMLEGIHLIPIVQTSAPAVSVSGPYGMMQWEKDGRSFQSPLSTLFTFPPEIQLTTHAPWPMSADITFSLPKEGENIRGYITWGLHGFFTMTYFNAQVTYLHQRSPLLYPWDTPCNVYRNQSPMDWSPFDTHDLLVEVAYPGPTS